jgi:hypothetical protein
MADPASPSGSLEPFEPLPRSAVVFRLVTVSDHFFPEGIVTELPKTTTYELTRDDIEEGIRRARPPLASVWREGATAVEQAKRIRQGHADQPHGNRKQREFVPFWLAVCAVEDISPGRLQVLHDPLPPTDGQGAEGHAGIAGIPAKPKNPKKETVEAKVQRKGLQDKLVEASHRTPPPWEPGGG